MNQFCFAPFPQPPRPTPVLNIQKAPQPRKCDLFSCVSNGQLKSHLQNLRLRGPNQVGGNSTHPPDDPLWQRADVVDHITKHDTLTPELRQVHRKESAKRHYHQVIENRPLLESTLNALVTVKRITKNEADEIFISRMPGGVKLKRKYEVLEEKVQQHSGTAGTEDLPDAAQEHMAQLEIIQQREQINQLMREKEQMKREITDTSTRLFTLSRNVSALFNPPEYMKTKGYKDRSDCSWPTEPSVEAFWIIYCMVVPHAEWFEIKGLPDVQQAWKRAQMNTNPDKPGNQAIAVDGTTDMRRITAVLTASRDMCLKYLGVATADDNSFLLTGEDQMAFEQGQAPLTETQIRERFNNMLNVWLQVRYRFQKAMIPQSGQLTFQYMAFVVDQASEELQRLEQGVS